MKKVKASLYIQQELYDLMTEYATKQSTSISSFFRWAVIKSIIPIIIDSYQGIVERHNQQFKTNFYLEYNELMVVLKHDGVEELVLVDIRNFNEATYTGLENLQEYLGKTARDESGFYVGLE